MTAPAAPVIRVSSANGSVVRVRWQPVVNAIDYKLYVGSSAAPSGLEADVPDSDVGTNGWFQYTFLADDVDTYLYLTALNIGAEESAHSTEFHLHLTGPG